MNKGIDISIMYHLPRFNKFCFDVLLKSYIIKNSCLNNNLLGGTNKY